MISEETWEKFRNGGVVFKCTTQGLWDKLIVELEEHGYDVSIAREKYKDYIGEGYGVDNESGEIEWCNIGYYKSHYPQLMVRNVTAEDFSESLMPTDYPQPPQELISILRALATCVLIEETHGVHLNLDELLEKRDEFLGKWESTFEAHL